MLERLEKHHLGFIVPVSSISTIEEQTGKQFTFDSIQGCHVLFEYQPILKVYFEYTFHGSYIRWRLYGDRCSVRSD